MSAAAPILPARASLSPRRGPIVLPTRFGGAFVGCSVLTLIGCINYQLSLGYALTFVMFSVWVVSAVHASRQLSGLTLSAAAPESAFAGGTAPFAVTLHNPSGLARTAMSVRLRGAALTLDVPPHADARGSLPVPAPRRGHLRLPTLSLQATDPLGLWRASREATLDLQTLVYPAPEEGAPPPPRPRLGGEGEGEGRVNGEGDVRGLRSYRPGDPLRRVAWRLAARRDELYVRELDAPAAHTLALDYADAAGLQGGEARLSRLTAWVLAASRQDARYSLQLPGVALPLGRGEGHASRALTALALYELPGEAPRPAPAGRASRGRR